jgi:tetratricopeptide (TPR) repeat protein
VLLRLLIGAVLITMTEGQRCRMLETIREYALELLAGSPAYRDTGDRHASWYVDLATTNEREFFGARQAEVLRRFEEEHDNFRAALTWLTRTAPNAQAAMRLASTLAHFWMARGHLAEARGWLETSLAMDLDSTEVRAKALSAAGGIAQLQGDLDSARTHHTEALAICRKLEMRLGLASTLSNLGTIASIRGDHDEAMELCEEAAVLFRELGDDARETATLVNLGTIAFATGDLDAARSYLERALPVLNRIGDARGASKALTNLGSVERALGNFAAARSHLEQSLALKDELGDRQGIAATLNALGDLALAEGEPMRGIDHHRQAIQIFTDLGDLHESALVLTSMAAAHAHGGHAERAARMFGAAEKLRTATGATILPADREDYERAVERARSSLDPAAFEVAWAEGLAMTSAETLSEVLGEPIAEDQSIADPAEVVDVSTRRGDLSRRQLAYEQAIEHYRRALDSLDTMENVDPSVRCALLIDLADSHRLSGDLSHAQPLYLKAVELARANHNTEAIVRCALGYASALPPIATVDEVRMRLLSDALAIVGADDHGTRAMLLANLAMSMYWSSDRSERMRIAQEAVREAELGGDDLIATQVIANATFAGWGPDDVEERARVADDILARDTSDRPAEIVMHAHRMRLTAALEMHDIDTADESIAEHARMAASSRNNGYLWESVLFRSTRSLLAGRFDDAEQLSERALRIGRPSQGDNATHLYFVQIFFIRRDQGRLDEIEPFLQQLIEDNPHVAGWRHGLVHVHAAIGKIDEAAAGLDVLAANGFEDHPRDFLWLVDLCLLADAVATIHDEERAAVLYASLAPYADRWAVVANAAACADSVAARLGRLAATQGRFDDAVAHLTAAVETSAAIGARPAEARARLHLARALTSRGGHAALAEAARHLEHAAATASELGMKAVAETARALRHLGPVADALRHR